MKDFIAFDDFLLPQERIATRPREKREQANLLSCLDFSGLDFSGLEDAPKDLRIEDLPSLLKRGDVVVLNDTKVLPARLQARLLACRSEEEETSVEVTLAERIEPNLFRAFVKGKINEQARLQFGEQCANKYDNKDQPFFAQLEGRDPDGLLRLRLKGISEEELYDRLEEEGAMPLPPYMKRKPDAKDKQDYQTLFARNRGAFAAPTAGRHFTPRLLEELQHKGIETLFITLHVSFGSFRPLRDDEVKASRQAPRMAREAVVVSAEVAARIQACKQRGGRVLAVGTTVVRALEAAALRATADDAFCGAFCGETDLFIAEGFSFQTCDLLLTNFHQARATPLLLTCAFAGEEIVKRAYAHARARASYRFFSYGDACLFARRARG